MMSVFMQIFSNIMLGKENTGNTGMDPESK